MCSHAELPLSALSAYVRWWSSQYPAPLLQGSHPPICSHPPRFLHGTHKRSYPLFHFFGSLLPSVLRPQPDPWTLIHRSVHISGHLLQTRPLRRFLHHLSEQPHNPLLHSFQMLTESVSDLHSIRSFPCCPNQHYTRQDSVTSRRNSSPLSACLPVPWNDNHIHDFQKLTHHIRDIPAS